MEKKKQTHIVYGFITGLAMIIVSAIIEVAKLGDNAALQWLSMVIMLIGLILNAQAYSKANDADITFGNAFGSCFKATAIIALLMIAWGFIVFSVFPGMEARMLEKAQEQMSKGNVSEEQADKAMEMTRKYFKVFAVAGALFGTLLQGAICSLIAAAIAKKKPRQQLTMQ
jgi:hypothetical protein